MDTFLKEGFAAVAAASDQQAALDAVGLPPDLVPQLSRLLYGLQSAQALWEGEQRHGRSNEVQAKIDALTLRREEALLAGDLACRNNQEGQQRLSAIREGEGLADLVQDGVALGLLLTDAAPLFAAIKFDAEGTARQLTELAGSLQQELSREEAGKTLSTGKDMRDRLYTLCLHPLAELRSFATFAFRNDRNNTRRFAFTSAYNRRRNRKARAPKTP